MGISWDAFGCSWVPLGGLLGSSGELLGLLRGLLGCSEELWGPVGVDFGASSGLLAALLASSLVHFFSDAIFFSSWGSLGVLVGFLGVLLRVS